MTLVTTSNKEKLLVIDQATEDVSDEPNRYLGVDHLNEGTLHLYEVDSFTDADDIDLKDVNPAFISHSEVVFEPVVGQS